MTSPWVRNVTEATFEPDVLEASDQTPVVVDFWSPSCAPCRALGPILERLTHEREGKVVLAKINTDDNPRLAAYFQIESIPAIKVIHKRQLVHEFEGLLPEPALREFFDQISPDNRDPDMVNAQAAEEAAPAKAETLYRAMIAKDPEKHEARVGLARVLLRLKKFDEIPDILEPIDTGGDLAAERDGLLSQIQLLKATKELPDEKTLRATLAAQPKHAETHLQLGSLLAAKGAYEESLKELYAAAELDYKLAQGQAREAMVKVFYTIGPNHPLSNEYRSKLSRLLY
jgi:putative thioredoxin